VGRNSVLFDVGRHVLGSKGSGKTPPNPVILSPAFWGEGYALCVFKPMQILRRLLAPQNDVIRGLFPQPVKPSLTRERIAVHRSQIAATTNTMGICRCD
jgi:hypothetical protein